MNRSPTQLSLAHLRDAGWHAEVVERWDRGKFAKRHDLFGFVDIVALRGAETLGVQATSYSNVSSRVRKIADAEHVGAVREAGWRLEVHGWWQPGGARSRYLLRVVDVS